MKVVIRKYQDKYKKQVIELFKNTFGRDLTNEFWIWRFENNPFGKPIIRLAFDNELLVGNYLLHPIDLQLGYQSIRGLFSMTTMIHPDYSGQGIMTQLASEVYKVSKKNNYDLIFGFANKNSRHMFTKKLGFNELASMQELRINITNTLNFNSKCSCSKINNFNELPKSEKLFHQEASKIMIPRTIQYLNWRFIQHPENDYCCYRLFKSEKFAGYFILKNYLNMKCHIVDFLIKDDLDCYNSMISQAAKFCRRNATKKLTLWANKNSSIYQYLKKIGFTENPQETFFITNILSEKIKNTITDNFDSWYITMGDSDIY